LISTVSADNPNIGYSVEPQLHLRGGEFMSVSSVSSNSSILWEQYLERQKKLQQQQTSSETSKNAPDVILSLAPDQLLSELQSLI
jgi:hypothetical protein